MNVKNALCPFLALFVHRRAALRNLPCDGGVAAGIPRRHAGHCPGSSRNRWTTATVSEYPLKWTFLTGRAPEQDAREESDTVPPAAPLRANRLRAMRPIQNDSHAKVLEDS